MALSPAPTIAYFTVVDDTRTGWTGGLLLLNKGGRPLEFQCTLPVRPTRAPEILYGLTLRQHLIGEVIGPLLIEKCRTPISILCCDQQESLSISAKASFPVALVREASERASSERASSERASSERASSERASSERASAAAAKDSDSAGKSDETEVDGPEASYRSPVASSSGGLNVGDTTSSSWKTILLAGSRLLVAETQAERVREITLQLTDLPDAVEPFERIREAIKKAQSQISRAPATRSPSAA